MCGGLEEWKNGSRDAVASTHSNTIYEGLLCTLRPGRKPVLNPVLNSIQYRFSAVPGYLFFGPEGLQDELRLRKETDEDIAL